MTNLPLNLKQADGLQQAEWADAIMSLDLTRPLHSNSKRVSQGRVLWFILSHEDCLLGLGGCQVSINTKNHIEIRRFFKKNI